MSSLAAVQRRANSQRALTLDLEEQHSPRIAHADGIPIVHTPSGKLTIVHQIHMSDRGGILSIDFLVFTLHNE